MITVTLTFNTLDEARKALFDTNAAGATTSPKLSAATPSLAPGTATARVGAAPGKTGGDKLQPVESVVAAPQASTAATFEGNGVAGSTAQVAPAASTASSTKPVEYQDVKNAILALATRNRDAASALVTSFNVKTFKDLTPDKWASALAAVQAKLAELGVE